MDIVQYHAEPMDAGLLSASRPSNAGLWKKVGNGESMTKNESFVEEEFPLPSCSVSSLLRMSHRAAGAQHTSFQPRPLDSRLNCRTQKYDYDLLDSKRFDLFYAVIREADSDLTSLVRTVQK